MLPLEVLAAGTWNVRDLAEACYRASSASEGLDIQGSPYAAYQNRPGVDADVTCPGVAASDADGEAMLFASDAAALAGSCQASA